MFSLPTDNVPAVPRDALPPVSRLKVLVPMLTLPRTLSVPPEATWISPVSFRPPVVSKIRVPALTFVAPV
jgi:hypothetical protein